MCVICCFESFGGKFKRRNIYDLDNSVVIRRVLYSLPKVAGIPQVFNSMTFIGFQLNWYSSARKIMVMPNNNTKSNLGITAILLLSPQSIHALLFVN